MEALLLIKAVIGIIITASIVITTRQIIVPPKPVLLYNPSQSAAIGWYRLQSKVPIERGSPKRPDIPVLGQDVLGRVMPQKSGCFVLKSDEFLLISPDLSHCLHICFCGTRKNGVGTWFCRKCP